MWPMFCVSPGGHRLVVATMRAVEASRYSSVDELGRHMFPDEQRVLGLAEEVRVDRSFSPLELDRARERDWDARIARALPHTDKYGLAEYLAAGPELLREWRNAWEPGASPRGAALVAAAVDCRRAGLLPARLLDQLTPAYLDRRGGSRLRPEPRAQAWQWATQPRRATTALIAGSDKAGYEVFGYLVDVTERDANERNGWSGVPEATLLAAVEHADGSSAAAINEVAHRQRHYKPAELAARRAAEVLGGTVGPEHPDTLASRGNLASALHGLGRPERAFDLGLLHLMS